MLVVDASVLSSALAEDGDQGRRARAALSDEPLCAPELVDLELASVWREALRVGRLTASRADEAFRELRRIGLLLAPHRPLLSRIWQLRDNVTPYDAAYVALAEVLGAPLVTADVRLSRAPGPRCAFRIVS